MICLSLCSCTNGQRNFRAELQQADIIGVVIFLCRTISKRNAIYDQKSSRETEEVLVHHCVCMKGREGEQRSKRPRAAGEREEKREKPLEITAAFESQTIDAHVRKEATVKHREKSRSVDLSEEERRKSMDRQKNASIRRDSYSRRTRD